MTRNIIVIIIAVIVFGIGTLVIQSALKPRPYNWFPSYSSYDKQPYGTSVLFYQLKEFFPGNRTKRLSDKDLEPYYPWNIFDLNYDGTTVEIDTSEYDDEFYEAENSEEYEAEEYYEEEDASEYDEEYYEEEYTKEEYEEDTTFHIVYRDSVEAPPFNILFIGRTFTPPDEKARAIFQHIYQGNDALISVDSFEEKLMDFLEVKLNDEELVHMEDESTLREYTIALTGAQPIAFKPFEKISYFESYPDNAEIIATNAEDRVVGIKLSIGEGTLTLFSLPILFTNYYVLKQDRHLTQKLLTSLPNKNTYWANYISDQPIYNNHEKRSILGFIHSQESLTWAFYVLLFSLLIFFIFQIKRKQRKIPVHLPPENTSVKFSNTLSNLYLNRRDNKDILLKKMNYFLLHVRDNYHLDTSDITEEFMKKLSIKSKVKLGVIKLLFYRYDTCSKQDIVSAEDFLAVNKLFQDFKKTEK